MEATALLERMRSDPTLNHGALWYGWLKRMKMQLTKCQRLHTESTATTLHNLKLRLASAQRAVDWVGGGAAEHAELAASRLAYDDAKAEHGRMARDQQFDFHANSNERGTTHFFRRPLGTKVPIDRVNVNGAVSTDEPIVQATFTDHWRTIMTAPADAQPPDPRRRRAVIESLTKRLDAHDRDNLDQPIMANELCEAMKTMNPTKSPGPDAWSAG
ncbi:Aste57867_15984 [Aphanomyces stellatus]|uniref:Aste57867_15984 protein n=1 Tax=Aphanomyces stellatus TaxID=120398 RepID=A0A485L5C9_9STRA|nr:hypothetical protein As57867_015928 [Aphanomyces stellatus]VFT92769.1 Aste57867_15984 [Aphanomyces stellatus]